MINLSESVILMITVYDTDSQLYCYNNHFLIISDTASASFILKLPFLVYANLNHEYDTEKFLWRKTKHITAYWVFTVSKRKMLKNILHMNNLFITEYFIELINLVTDIKIRLSLLWYNKEYNNVYNILLLKYHDFTDSWEAVSVWEEFSWPCYWLETETTAFIQKAILNALSWTQCTEGISR